MEDLPDADEKRINDELNRIYDDIDSILKRIDKNDPGRPSDPEEETTDNGAPQEPEHPQDPPAPS